MALLEKLREMEPKTFPKNRSSEHKMMIAYTLSKMTIIDEINGDFER
jgi:hypothetical protein